MKVKQLYEFLKNNLDSGAIKADTEVIIEGEYGYGDSLGTPYITKKTLLDEKTVIKDSVDVVAISIGTYVFECEDVGYSRMWLDPKEAEEYLAECGEEDE